MTKWTNNDLQNTTQKTKDWTPQKPRVSSGEGLTGSTELLEKYGMHGMFC